MEGVNLEDTRLSGAKLHYATYDPKAILEACGTGVQLALPDQSIKACSPAWRRRPAWTTWELSGRK